MVIASPLPLTQDVASGGAGAGVAGVTAVADVTLSGTKVTAALGSIAGDNTATIYAGDIRVSAESDNETLLVGTGAAAGAAGVAGTVSVLKFTDAVNGFVSGTITADSVYVAAQSDNNATITAGSLAGGAAGIAPAVTTFIFDGTTNAQLGNGTVISGGDVTVLADSNEDVDASAAAAAVGGFAGSDSVAAVISDITTSAVVGDDVTMDISGTLKIAAEDTPSFGVTAGAVSGGGTGAGAAVDVLVFYNTVAAGVGNNADITAGAVDIDALVDRNLTMYAAAGSGGGVAVSGSVIVVAAGKEVTSGDHNTALSSNKGSAIGTVDQNVNDAINNAALKDNASETGTNQTSSAIGRANSRLSSVNTAAYFNQSSLADKISAYIGANGSFQVNGNLSVDANEKTTIEAVAGTVAAGGAAVGGSVLITTLNSTTEAFADSELQVGGTANISATNTIGSGNAGYKAIAGSAGAVGLGASVSVLEVSGNANAEIRGAVTANGDVNLNSQLTIRLNPTTASAAVGAVAAGVSTAVTEVTGTTQAGLANGGSILKAKNVTIKANLTGATTAYSVAAGGGFAGAVANVADVTVNNTVKTFLDQGSKVCNADTLNIKSISDLYTYVKAEGLAAGAVAVGASNAILTMNGTLASVVEDGALVQVNTLNQHALYNVRENFTQITGNNQYADVFAGVSSGGGVIENLAEVFSKQKVTVDFNGDLTASNADLRAMGYYYSKTTAKAMAGCLASVGVSVSRVQDTSVTSAVFGGNANNAALSILANAKVNTEADATPTAGIAAMGSITSNTASDRPT